jgi:putative oxidoreductase
MHGVFRQIVLLGRLTIGGIFVAHGWQKLMIDGISTTQSMFQKIGVPAPDVTAYLVAFVELAAGLALMLGLLLPLAGLLLAVDMLGAFIFVHGSHGVFVQHGGFELVAALGVGALLIGFSGGGTLALDRVLMRVNDRHLRASG